MQYRCNESSCNGRKFSKQGLAVHRARAHKVKDIPHVDPNKATSTQNGHQAVAEELVAMNEMVMGYDSLSPAARNWFKERVLGS